MSQVIDNLLRRPRGQPKVPQLVNGDRLTRDEFERRYAAAPDVKAELVEGVVYVASPVSLSHSLPHAMLVTLCGLYVAATKGLTVADNSTVRLDAENEPQPDIFIMRSYSGAAKRTEDDYVEGAPEWVAEIAASSASYDLHDKRDAYERNGIREYLVWRTLDEQIDYFLLRDGSYRSAAANADGVMKSEQFLGLWIDVDALLRGNLAAAIATLQAGIASPEHAAFVQSLTAAP